MSLALMVMAAGRGTRMGALTADRPKPLLAVAGRPLIDHALALAEEAGADPVVVNLHHHAALLRAHLAGRRVRLSEEPELLETGGGLKAALPLLGHGPVLTLNSDAAWRGPNPLALLRDAWRPGMGALLVLIPPGRARAHGAGDFTLRPDGTLAWGGPWTYAGAQVIGTGPLAAMTGAFGMRRLWDAHGTLHGLPYPGEWCDVGTPEGIAEAERMLGHG